MPPHKTTSSGSSSTRLRAVRALSSEGDVLVHKALAEIGVHQPYLLCPARLENPSSNHVRLLRAFASSSARSTHALVLVGADWGAASVIRAEMALLGIADRVCLAGYVEDRLVTSLIAGADAVVLVGLGERLGAAAIEALGAGRPLIAARTIALTAEAAALAALCDPFDQRSIQGAIERALSDEELRRQTGQEGLEAARRVG